MLKAVEGVYKHGKIELSEVPSEKSAKSCDCDIFRSYV